MSDGVLNETAQRIFDRICVILNLDRRFRSLQREFAALAQSERRQRTNSLPCSRGQIDSLWRYIQGRAVQPCYTQQLVHRKECRLNLNLKGCPLR